jgi:hypothetical protein
VVISKICKWIWLMTCLVLKVTLEERSKAVVPTFTGPLGCAAVEHQAYPLLRLELLQLRFESEIGTAEGSFRETHVAVLP